MRTPLHILKHAVIFGVAHQFNVWDEQLEAN